MSEADLKGIQIRALYGLDGFDALRQDWIRLQGTEAPYYLEPGWFREVVRHEFGSTRECVFLVANDPADGRVIGILPVERITERIRRLRMQVWSLVGSRRGDATLLGSSADFLCESKELEAPVLSSARNYLASLRDGSALLRLGRVTAGSTAYRAAFAIPAGVHLQVGASSRVDTDRAYDSLMGELSANFRANLRKFRNRGARVGRLVYSTSRRSLPCFEEAYADFLRVESSGWKGRYGIGGAMATNPSTTQRDFVQAVFFGENECHPQVHRLLLDGVCISALLTVRSGGTLVALKIGHDEAYRPLGPGHLIIDQFLRSCCEDHAIMQAEFLAQTRWMEVWRPITLPHHHFYLGLNQWQGILGLALLRLPSLKGLGKLPPM